MPNVPTFAELSYRDSCEAHGSASPFKSKTPGCVDRIAEAHRAVVARPRYKERLDTLAMGPLILTSQQTQMFLKNEMTSGKSIR
ncbi:MAG: hypothetical protein KIT18_00350 [Burkholderiales bacterium]|nr:hypothetical protein [Burkholderiales bacterium]